MVSNRAASQPDARGSRDVPGMRKAAAAPGGDQGDFSLDPSHEQLTSFGFLDEDGNADEAGFGFGNIFSRMRSAFGPSEQDASTSVGQHPAQTPSAQQSTTVQQAMAPPPPGAPLGIRSPQLKSSAQLDFTAAGHGAPNRPSRLALPSKQSGTPHPRVPSHASILSDSSRKASGDSVSSATGSRNIAMSKTTKPASNNRGSRPPFAVVSSTFAPAITSTAAAHAVAPRRFQSITTETLDEEGEDVLSTLMRKSGVDQSRKKAAHFSTVPGFPLSKDTLADDARSIHSASSRMPRSETQSTSEAHLVVAQRASNSRGGLETSAEAFRRMRGEGTVLSKAFWMPDESVKECRECQSYFTPLRRKHHCRICGLVYCSRCASHIVSGSRFGLDRADIRVCNFCLRVLSEYERAGRQTNGHTALPGSPTAGSSPQRVATSFARKRTESGGINSRPDKDSISAPLEAQLKTPQSQFAANELFSHRGGLQGSALALAQRVPRMDSLQDMLDELEQDSLLPNEAKEDLPTDKHVPFRVKMGDEDRVPAFDDDLAGTGYSSKSPTKIKPLAQLGARSELRRGISDEVPSKTMRARDTRSKLLGEAGYADARERTVGDAALRAARKSRLRAREAATASDASGANRSSIFANMGPTRRESLTSILTAKSEELDGTGARHVSWLLGKLLARADLPNKEAWQRVLEPLIRKVVRYIHPHPKVGESMDIRQYIKFKRIPGGSIKESEYADGFVLSKQVATKKMARLLPISNPRVMVVTFPIDFHRAEEQFMSLEPVLSQEHEYTRILVARILQLRPNVLVVRDTVSRLALDMLEDAGILVVWNVKTSAIQAISRCCQADIISSIERIAFEPRLGRCAQLSVETYQHAQSTQCRKSLMRFQTSGHARSLGCSIILRGPKLETLGEIKRIMSVMAFSAHNLRLEEQLNRDEGAQLTEGPGEQSLRRESSRGGETSMDAQVGDQDELWKQIMAALEPFEEQTLSSSVGVAIPPPYQLLKMREAHKRLKLLQQDVPCEPAEVVLSSDGHVQEKGRTVESEKGHETASEKGPKDNVPDEKDVTRMPTLEEVMPRPSEGQAQYTRALMDHQLFLKEWLSCTRKDPTSSLQRISILWTMISTSTHKPCIGPRLITTVFYGHGDETLGQYLERTCNESSMLCPAKGCGRPRGMHYSSFVHNDTRVQVVLERFVCPIPGQENKLLMWSYCKRCERATPVTPVSDDTWALSFAKYLELHFYDGHKITTMCGHDYYSDFVRFFSLQNLALRFHRDRDIVVRDVVLPPMRLLPRPDVDYRLKLESAKSLQERMNTYWTSIIERMTALRKEPCLSAQHASQLDNALVNARKDELEVKTFLIDTLKSSKQTDMLVLNRVRNKLQASVVRWDHFFHEIERIALPNERDVRRLTTHHLSNIFQQDKSEEARQAASSIGEALGLTPAVEADENAAMTEQETALSSSVKSSNAPEQVCYASSTKSDDGPTPQETDYTASARDLAPDSVPEPGATQAEPSQAASTPKRGSKVRRQAPTKSATLPQDVFSEVECRSVRSGSSDAESMVQRPMLRRGKTTEDVMKAKSPPSRKTSRIARPDSGIPSSPPIPRRTLAIARRAPPSSYRPPKSILNGGSSGVETESDGNVSVHTRRKLSVGKRKGRLQALEAAKSIEGAQDDQRSPKQSRLPSRVPVPARPSRVSTIARRFDHLHREAVRESERQRLVRARRARPILASQPLVQVYRSVKDAVRDDDEDEQSDTSASAGEGQEAEDEGDSDTGGRRPTGFLSRKASSQRQETPTNEAPCEAATQEGDRIAASAASPKRLSTHSPEISGSVSSPEHKRRQPPPPSRMTSMDASGGRAIQGPETAGAELTMSSFLSGTLPASWRASLLSDTEHGETRGSLLKTLTSLWARGSLNLPPIELPMRSTEHLFTDSPLVVLREDEPSSLIAFTLSSTAYAGRLEALRNSDKGADERKLPVAASEANDSANVDPTADRDDSDIAFTLRKTEGTHLNFQFSSGDSRFSIRVLFTEQFDAMRHACDRGQTFVQSLSRCWNWSDCSGGKSGAAMMKTLDDRFVIKQLSRAEMDAFASNAGAYFRFIADVLFQDRPTTLAKIYGIFRLTIRNSQTGKSIKLDCVIAENVFANAKMAQTYDLKGALRNRFVQPTGQPNQVLLDGNLITAKTPIYLREGSKRLLRQALYHDSLFLANCDVMDYSLVVGVCEGSAELRVGIIDFIRTFTFGKKAESFIKEAVGGGTEAPTIIDPKQYRARFLSFLESVLLLSPDHWLSDEETHAQSGAGATATTTAALHANVTRPVNHLVLPPSSAPPSTVPSGVSTPVGPPQ